MFYTELTVLTLGLYFVFYLCVMACYAMMAVPYNGLIADQTPPSQRGEE